MIYRNESIVSDAARFLAATMATMNPVAMCVPTNLSEVGKNWKACAKSGGFFNPTFEYDTDELKRIALFGFKISNYWTQIKLNCSPQNDIDNAILNILESRICDAILTAEMASGIVAKDDARTLEAIHGIYGKPSGTLTALCYDVIANPGSYTEGHHSRFAPLTLNELSALQLTAADIRKHFLSVFAYYGFGPAWECVIDPKIQNAIDARDKTTSGKSQLVIPAKKVVDGRALCSLIGHEIESHVRGSENSRALFRQLLGNSPLSELVNVLAKSDDETFYEGVAKTSDVAVNGDKSLPHPYYVIAIDIANQGGDFATVAQTIRTLKHDATTSEADATDFAWNIARRVFRGCTDTSKGGFANTKDYAYFTGYHLAKNVPTAYFDYSSMTVADLQMLENAGVNLSQPAYPRKDAIKLVTG